MDAFAGNADFSDISNSWPLKVSSVNHGAAVEVNVNGTVGAAATGKIVTSVTRSGDFLDLGQFFKAFGTNDLPKSPTFLGNFCKGVKINHFSSEITFRQLF